MKKRNKRISQKKLISIIILSIALLTLLGILFIPNIIEKKEINNLRKEITMVDEYLFKDEKNNIDTIKKYIEKDITTGKRKKVETAIDNYLKDILKNSSTIDKIINDNKINTITIDYINDKEITNYLKDKQEELTKIKDNINNIDSNNYLNSKDIYSKELYRKILKRKITIKDYLKKIDSINITNNIEIITYLNNNKDNWKTENNIIIFTKRNKYNEYKEKIEKLKNIKSPNYELIKDTEGPKIEANDITIYKGNEINLKDKIKCTDEVDDDVECIISGDYDINKIGTYSINIKSEDISKNKTEKNINLIVKEKVIYKNPYYTEVIRNQNTVIVYGLDSNNEYTKIVKVMPCSVGRDGHETPTGTFTTTDKYRWGGLYGGVWGQYSTRIVSDILFHSVPYYSEDPSDLEWEEYNKLGSPASLGCIRMTVRDVKWIYDNCPKGMTVKIYDGNLPNGVSKPSAPKIDGNSPNKGWDPTDPSPNNPWN